VSNYSTPYLLLTVPIEAQDQLLSQAQQLVKTKSYSQALYVYERVLDEDPQNLEALRHKAVILSWKGQHKTAAAHFKEILALHPDDVPTLNAAAYNLAWWGNYVQAESLFRKIVVLDPLNQEAAKGLAYVALWKGRGKLAINRFNRLLATDKSNGDLKIGLGHALLLSGRQREARAAFQEALGTAKDVPASELLGAVQSAPGWMEVAVWGGFAQFESDQSWGLRSAELSFQPTNQFRIWARYDNSLSLENLALVRNRAGSDGYFLGGYHQWNKTFLSKVELGYRDLSEISEGSQYMLLFEQLVFFQNGKIIKGGFFTTDTESGADAWTAYGGVAVPIATNWSLEPLYYYTQIQDQNVGEHRLQLNSYLTLKKGHQLNGGIFGGRLPDSELANPDVYGALLSWVIPTAGQHWTTLMVRYESGIQDILVLSLGFKYRFER